VRFRLFLDGEPADAVSLRRHERDRQGKPIVRKHASFESLLQLAGR